MGKMKGYRCYIVREIFHCSFSCKKYDNIFIKAQQFLSILFSRKTPQVQYEIWAADFFDYRDVEWICYAVYTDKDQAEAELEKLRREAGGEHSIIKFRLQERVTR